MLQFNKYERPATPLEALELLKKSRNSAILGGGIWMRLGTRRLGCAIDLSACGLDRIERIDLATGEVFGADFAAAGLSSDVEGPAAAPAQPAMSAQPATPALPGDAWRIGAMVTLRQLETHSAFNASTCGVFRDAVQDIVGVQMRNSATVGGSVFGRFGFSDVLTALLPLGCEIELAGEGRVPLAKFAARTAYERDVLSHVIVPDHADLRASFQCVRRSATDFSVLNVCAAFREGAWHVAVGARPARALLIELIPAAPGAPTDETLAALEAALAEVPVGSNMRGSAKYRAHLARELGRRAVLAAAGVANEGQPAAVPSPRPAEGEEHAAAHEAEEALGAPTAPITTEKGGEA